MKLARLTYGPIQQTEINIYLQSSGDDNPIHYDVNAARTVGFDNIVVPGLFLLGFIERALETWEVKHYDSLKAQFSAPLLIGSLVHIEGRFMADGSVIRILVKDTNDHLICIAGVEKISKA